MTSYKAASQETNESQNRGSQMASRIVALRPKVKHKTCIQYACNQARMKTQNMHTICMQPGQDENPKHAYNRHLTRPGRKPKTCIQYAYSRDGMFLRLVSLSYVHVWIKNNKDAKNEKKGKRKEKKEEKKPLKKFKKLKRQKCLNGAESIF